jgi:hypothetical protein
MKNSGSTEQCKGTAGMIIVFRPVPGHVATGERKLAPGNTYYKDGASEKR